LYGGAVIIRYFPLVSLGDERMWDGVSMAGRGLVILLTPHTAQHSVLRD
jgi:hypothetical protein